MLKRLLAINAMISLAISTFGAQVFSGYGEDTIGIRFQQTLKWSEILAKAKKEHKYIFVDCNGSWCGTCKLMEANIYPVKAVGDTYNKDFICVKVQTDKSVADYDSSKSWYKTAKQLEMDYAVNTYPNFLFFNPDGKPVHKVSGSFDVNAFVRLAADAQNPDKQYYTILKKFKPLNLDTAEEKELVWAFMNSDKEFAGEIAADYLSRIPQSQLKQSDNARLMVKFQDNPQVLDFALSIINSFSKADFTEDGHAQFIEALITQPKVKVLLVNYINGFSYKEMGEADNMNFILRFRNDAEVLQIA